MAETGAAFGGEHSAHYYFRDNFRADSGLIAAMHVLEQLCRPRPAAVGAAQAVRALRRLRRDQHQGRRPAGRHRAGGGRASAERRARTASTASPSTSATGGSTSARPTPSRCCASTSKPDTRDRVRRPRRRCPRPHHQGDDAAWLSIRKLLEILACPEDKGPLLYFETRTRSTTPACKRRYEIRDDIPVMLIDEAETVDDAEHERLLAKAEAESTPSTLS